MKTRLLGVVAACVLALAPARAATISVDISDLAGFAQKSGWPVYQSIGYTFAPGDTVNFGTAVLNSFYQTQGVFYNFVPGIRPEVDAWVGASPTDQQFNAFWSGRTGQGGITNCPSGIAALDPCSNRTFVYDLSFTLPQTESMITLMVFAPSFTIIPPVGALPYQTAVPLPATLPLFAAGLGLLGLLSGFKVR